ncbi:MAG: NAD(P)-dependent oxidoreductase [Chloroflexi bacterium]|nr:NAD(P)-dependent oxidoreductase [Chloroflexota bacterium]
MNQVVITGATGPLGIALCKYLAELGISVTAIARPGSRRRADIPVSQKIQIIECDLGDLFSLSDKIGYNYDTFFHIAWDTGSREIVNDPLIQSRQVIYPLDAVRLAHNLGCRAFVGAGSQGEYGNSGSLLAPDSPERPVSSYSIAKYAAGKLSRQLCESFGMRHCWGRILSLYGPFDKETTSIMYCVYTLLKGERPVLTKSEQMWDFIYSVDCAKAFYLIATKGRHGMAYPIGTGKARSMKEYFECIRGYINPSLKLGFGEKPYAPNQLMLLCSDNTVLKTDTGFEPEYTFEEGIRETIEWAKKRVQTENNSG